MINKEEELNYIQNKLEGYGVEGEGVSKRALLGGLYQKLYRKRVYSLLKEKSKLHLSYPVTVRPRSPQTAKHYNEGTMQYKEAMRHYLSHWIELDPKRDATTGFQFFECLADWIEEQVYQRTGILPPHNRQHQEKSLLPNRH